MTTGAGSSAQVREAIARALRLDLIGPRAEDEARAREVLPASPSSYYLTGFLVPDEAEVEARSDPEPQSELDAQPAHPAGDDDVAVDARRPRGGRRGLGATRSTRSGAVLVSGGTVAACPARECSDA